MHLTSGGVFSQVCPFSDELIAGRWDEAEERLSSMTPLDAVRLVLLCAVHGERVTDEAELIGLGEHLGIFSEEIDG